MLQQQSITGLKCGPNHMTTVVPFKWVLENCISGLVLEQAERDMAEGLTVDERAGFLAPLRAKMQRPFQYEKIEYRSRKGERIETKVLRDTPKLKNTRGPLRDYLIQQFAPSPEEAFGVLPNFVIVFPEELASQPVDASVPGVPAVWERYDFGDVGRACIADGECRHLAGLEIRADQSVGAAIKDRLLEQYITVEVWHGVEPEKIAQMFCDLNFEGVQVDNITRANLDPRNKWIQSTKRIFEALEIPLATDGRQITNAHRNEGQHLLLTHAEQMVRSVALGYNAAISRAGKHTGEASWNGIDFDRLEKACIDWFGIIFSHFDGIEVTGDQSQVIRTVPVRLALAELGSRFYDHDLEGMATARNVLKDVNWLVDNRWHGIAGKVTESDDGTKKLAASGVKENGKRAVAALSNKQSKAYWEIRGLKFPGAKDIGGASKAA